MSDPTQDPVPQDPVYSVVAAFAGRLEALGVTEVVISPGSRSTPLALCFDARPAMRTWIQIDERCAGFFALGLARATGLPAVLVSTSGTAAANYLPAVVEACHGGVPMIVCTADRPAELRGWGSPQTIDQVGLYGSAVRSSVDLPSPDEATLTDGVAWADEAFAHATAADLGPVHLNWPLREPLEPIDGVRVASADDPGLVEQHDRARLEADALSGGGVAQPGGAHGDLAELAELAARYERGVVLVGPWPGGGLRRERRWAASARRFAAWARWPLIAEPITNARTGLCEGREQYPAGSGLIATAGHLLEDHGLADELRPDVVVLFGRTVTTKPVRTWLERTAPRHVILIDPEDRWQSAAFRLTGHAVCAVEAVETLTQRPAPKSGDRIGGWLDTWSKLDSAARHAINEAVGSGPLLSALTARILVDSLPRDSALIAANSMPVRDLDAFVFDTRSLACSANRGASGIDGTVSTALGVAAADPARTVALYIGDLALLHDLGGLIAAARLGLSLIVVCVDNSGGEIFSLLPIAERIPQDDFERLFRTPHGLDLLGLNGFGGIRATRVSEAASLGAAIRGAASQRTPGVDLLVVDVSHDADVAQRRALSELAIAAAGAIAASADRPGRGPR